MRYSTARPYRTDRRNTIDVMTKTIYTAYYNDDFVRSQITLNTYENSLAQLTEDFINTYDLYLDEPEHLREPEDLRRFLVAHGVEIGETVTARLLEAARDLRGALRASWTAETLEIAIQGINRLLAPAPVQVQVVAEGENLTVQFESTTTDFIQQLGVLCARGVIALVQTHGLDRLRCCAAEPCRDVFVDTSRNKSRRFCSDRCANRYNIAAFRGRQGK